ncbi:hypothetical protein N7536_010983 [Penicillium majusculum]|nr:hypothetical protein N7536_010983 [Penicillium majusculum]
MTHLMHSGKYTCHCFGCSGVNQAFQYDLVSPNMWSLMDIMDITHIVGYSIPNKPSQQGIEIGRRLTKT